MTATAQQARLGIFFICVGLLGISLNDVLVKMLSGGYPLHQIVFTRSAIGILFSLLIVQWEGGLRQLRTDTPGLHALRGGFLVLANMAFFAALAVLPLAETTALFFVAPLFITFLSIPLLGERVGPARLTAVLVGFLGVFVMQRPWLDMTELGVPRIILLLPVFAALTYALTQIMTRKLGAQSTASALAVYVQIAFLVVAILSYLLVGDGRFAADVESPALKFLLRAWVWPAQQDIWLFATIGLNSALIGYALSAAYRLGDATSIAPFEYLGLPLSVLWGIFVFSETPDWEVWIGMVFILGSGLFVFLREGRQRAPKPPHGPIDRT